MSKNSTSVIPFLERSYFESLKNYALSQISKGEHLYLTYAAESTHFIRVNGARIRQIGRVEDASLTVALLLEPQPGKVRKATRSLTLTGNQKTDEERVLQALTVLQNEVLFLPEDPYAKIPQNNGGSSSVDSPGNLLSLEEAPEALLAGIDGLDIAGIYASGPVVRAMANSAGLMHWFKTETFSFDHSIYTPEQRAVKGVYAGSHWDPAAYRRAIADAERKLNHMRKPARKIERGSYRTYLEPAAAAEIFNTLFGVLGEASFQQGESPLRRMREGHGEFSRLLSVREDFTGGEVPRFNQEGDLSQEKLLLLGQGKLIQTLVNSRSAKEYGVPSNGADGEECLRSPVVDAGALSESEILKRLGTGLYVSNLHYLNWSDKPQGRITGMTRYASFWVENGEILAPIENMRFDDSLFSLLGSALEQMSQEQKFLPEVGTYVMRGIGGMRVPGVLLSEMKFTL